MENINEIAAAFNMTVNDEIICNSISLGIRPGLALDTVVALMSDIDLTSDILPPVYADDQSDALYAVA